MNPSLLSHKTSVVLDVGHAASGCVDAIRHRQPANEVSCVHNVDLSLLRVLAGPRVVCPCESCFSYNFFSQLISTSSFFDLLFDEIQRTLLHLMRT